MCRKMSIQEIHAVVVSFNDESFLRTEDHLQFRSGPEERLIDQKFAMHLPEVARTREALFNRPSQPAFVRL
jgi:hypothetical protein